MKILCKICLSASVSRIFFLCLFLIRRCVTPSSSFAFFPFPSPLCHFDFSPLFLGREMNLCGFPPMWQKIGEMEEAVRVSRFNPVNREKADGGGGRSGDFPLIYAKRNKYSLPGENGFPIAQKEKGRKYETFHFFLQCSDIPPSTLFCPHIPAGFAPAVARSIFIGQIELYTVDEGCHRPRYLPLPFSAVRSPQGRMHQRKGQTGGALDAR